MSNNDALRDVIDASALLVIKRVGVKITQET